jgi:ribonuclease HI
MGKKSKQKYYAVWKGKETGVFDSWGECKKQVQGFEGAQYKSFKTKEAAFSAFNNSPEDFIGKAPSTRGESELSPDVLALIGKPIEESICVDAAYDGDVMEYQGVYTKTGKKLFLFGPFEGATNNVGEFLAIVHALGYLQKQRSVAPVYSDSITALHWVKLKHANTKLKKTPETKSLLYLVERAEKWLHQNKYLNKLLKWETKAWGENPADFGRK